MGLTQPINIPLFNPPLQHGKRMADDNRNGFKMKLNTQPRKLRFAGVWW